MTKRYLVVAFALVFALSLAVGIARAGGDEHGKKMDVAAQVAKMKTELNLTDQQADKVKALIEDIHKRKAEIREKSGGMDSAEAHEQMKKLMADHDAKLKEILTADQFAKYQEMRAKHEKEMGEHHKK